AYLRVFCRGDNGKYLTDGEYGLPAIPAQSLPSVPNPVITVIPQGRYQNGGSWMLCDLLTYLTGTCHGVDTDTQQGDRILAEVKRANGPGFKEALDTVN